MKLHPQGAIAVIFMAKRTGDHEAEYSAAASRMTQMAAEQPGYLGEDHARSEDGTGITVSYWSDDESAKAWRDHSEHAAIREAGRDRWYEYYTLHVARVERRYDWRK